MFVLPAEYAVDPLGIGARTGLLDLGLVGQQVEALSGSAATTGATATIVVPQDRAFKQETVEFKVGPREGMEYKYRLDKGEALLYSWKTTGPVNYEFHAEPDGAPRGYAQTYEKVERKTEASGTLTAPFPGIHGWYWENTTDQEITVDVGVSGLLQPVARIPQRPADEEQDVLTGVSTCRSGGSPGGREVTTVWLGRSDCSRREERRG